jgi:HAD superfamily hydrolase (TIGR01490 family)
MTRSFAFFDLDHTLLPFDTQTLFCNFVLKRERWRTLLHLTFAPLAVLRACKLIRTVTAKRAFMNYLAGMKREQLRIYASEFAGQIVRPAVYPELLAIIEEHRKAGRVLVLNTASPDFYAHEIALALGFDHCIATLVEVPEALPLLPRVLGENNKREAKIARMRAEIPSVAEATDAELADSWAYSDSAADLPLLEFAGNGVLVHPNAALEAIGKQRGWKVLRPARPYSGKVGDMFCAFRQVLGLYSLESSL